MNKVQIEAISAAAARWIARRDAGLQPADQVEFERWLAADPRHGRALDHYSRTWSVFDRPARAGTTEAILNEMTARGKRKRTRRAQIAAVGMVVVISFVTFWKWSGVRDEPKARNVAAGAVVLQPERRVLRDGSIVDLKPGAEIDVRYTDAARRVVLLRGEAHFQVVKHQPRPFLVDVGDIQVRAVGTAFAVQLNPAQVEVLVTEGRVAVEKANAVAPEGASKAIATSQAPAAPLATVGVCEHVIIDIGPGSSIPVVHEVSPAELSERLAWRMPRLEFTGTPLRDAIDLINQSPQNENADAGRVRLVLAPDSADLGKEPVSGLFRADNAEAFVQVLKLSLGIDSERRGNDIILRKNQR